MKTSKKSTRKKNTASRFIRQYSAKLRSEIESKVQKANASVSPARRVSLRSAIEVANRSLATTTNYSPRARVFSALRSVDSFIALATKNKQTSSAMKHADLLAIGHPASLREHSMNSASLRSEKARWLAADPLVAEEYRPLVAAAFSAFPGSVEREHAFIRLSIAPAGAVPAHLRIDEAFASPITAAFGLGGGNSSAARSLRAKLQRRDRKGRFAEMGGGWSFNLRMPDGVFRKISGRVVGQSKTDDDGIEVEIRGSKLLPNGVYKTQASKGESAKAILPEAARKGLPKIDKTVGTDDVFVDFKDIRPTRTDAPSGWSKNVLGTYDGDMLKPSRVAWVNDETAYVAVESLDRNGNRESLELRRGLDESLVKGAEKLDDWGDVQQAIDRDQPDYIKALSKDAEGRAPKAQLPEKPEGERVTPEIVKTAAETLNPGNADPGSTYEKSTWTLPDGSRIELNRKDMKGEYIIDKIRPAREGDEPSRVRNGEITEDTITLDAEDADVEEQAFDLINSMAGAPDEAIAEIGPTPPEGGPTAPNSITKGNGVSISFPLAEYDEDPEGFADQVQRANDLGGFVEIDTTPTLEGADSITVTFDKPRLTPDEARQFLGDDSTDGAFDARFSADAEERQELFDRLTSGAPTGGPTPPPTGGPTPPTGPGPSYNEGSISAEFDGENVEVTLDETSPGVYNLRATNDDGDTVFDAESDDPSIADFDAEIRENFGQDVLGFFKPSAPGTAAPGEGEPSAPSAPEGPRNVISTEVSEKIDQLQEAIDAQAEISFVYNGKERTIVPEGMWRNEKTGNTNVYGLDKSLGEKRTYTVEKIEPTVEPEAPSARDRQAPTEITPLRGEDAFELRTAIEDAIQSGKSVSFTYNDKDRIFTPERIYTNPKSGTTNVVGFSETDGEERTFIIEKMQTAQGDVDIDDINELDQMLSEEFDRMFDTPEGAYKPDIFDYYRPKGRTNEVSEDFTDDPEILSTKFTPAELGKALAEAVLPSRDGERATGRGRLEFESGEESVSAEAIFDALQRSGVDGEMLLAGIYDRALDVQDPDRLERNTDKVQMFRADMGIGPDGDMGGDEIPSSRDDLDNLRNNIPRGSERLTRTARVGTLLADHEERNEILKNIASALRSDAEITLDEFFSKVKDYASSPDPDEQEAFKGAWGILMSIDGGDTPDDLEEAGFSSWRANIVNVLGRDAESREVAEDEYYSILQTHGGYAEFMASRQRIMDGDEDLDANSTGAAFYRLVDEAGTPNDTAIYRVVTVRDDETLGTYLSEGAVFYMDYRSWTTTDISDGSIASQLFMAKGGGTRVIFEVLPGDVSKSLDISGISWFDGEDEVLAGGRFQVVSGRRNSDTEYVIQLREVPKESDEMSSGVENVGSISDWERYSEGTGSNPGGFYRDADGNEYYVKVPKSRSHAENEALAALLYKRLNVSAAGVSFGDEDGELRIVSPLVPGAQPDDIFTRVNGRKREILDREYVEKLQQGFVADAWLGNYDVIGYFWDMSTNVVTDENGDPVRVDPGGALMWRARGAAKGEMFGDDATELDSLRDPDLAEQASIFFGDLADDQLREYAKPLRDLIPSEIDSIIDSVITDPSDADLLKRKLKSRRRYILDKLGIPEGADDTELFQNPEPLTDAMGYEAQNLLPGDITASDSFVIEKVFYDEETPKGKVSIQGYFPGHESQRKEWNESTIIDVARGSTIPPKGDKPALHRPKPPRKPSPGAFTGQVKEMLAGVDNWEEAADVIRGMDMVFFDYETTGFASEDEPDALNRPVQLGAVRVQNGKVVDRFNVYMNPETPMTKWSRENLKTKSSDMFEVPEATYRVSIGWEVRTIDSQTGEVVSVEQIDPSAEPEYELLTDEWLGRQMPMGEAHRRFIEWIGEGSVILGGQYTPFDLEVLQRTLDEQGLSLDIAGTIDSKDIAAGSLPKWTKKSPVGPMQIGPNGTPRASNSLGPVADFLGVDISGWHRADADAEASWNIIDAMLTRAVENPDTPTTILDVEGSFEKDAMQSAFYKAELEQYKQDLAEYEAAKAVAAAWNCGGAGLTAAVGDGNGPCDVPSVDDLIERVSRKIIEPVDIGDVPSAQGSTIDRDDKDGVDVKDPYADEKFPPTDQQKAIVDAVLTGENTVARALAGTGKTSTLQLIARRLQKEQPNKRIIYVAFNKSIQLEADAKMPGNVESRTADSIAYRASDKKIRAKMNNKNALVKIKDIAANFGITGMRDPDNPEKMLSTTDVVKAVRDAVNKYTISADDEIGPQHFEFDNVPDQLIDWANAWWADIQDPDGKLRVTNSHLTKMWALTRPDLRSTTSGVTYGADVIFFDEAQDINPVLGKVIADQKIQVVYVGDSNQAIYGFRGAVDQLDGITAPNDLPLTKSWRFGPEIAGMGNRFLTLIGSRDKIEGAGPSGEVLPAGTMEDADAVLVRTNAGAIKEIFNELGRGRVVGVTKNYKDDLKSFNESARWLQSGASPASRPRKVHDDISPYSSWDELMKDVQSGENRKVAKLIELIDDIGFDGIDDMLDNLVVYKSSEDGVAPSTGVGEAGGLAPMSGASGASGDVIDGVQYSIVDNEIRLTGSQMFPNKEAAKAKGFKWRPETKTWYKSYNTEAARLSALNDLRSAMGGPSAADSRKIDVVITTAHRSKGLEWDSVRIGGDFWGPRINKETGEPEMPAPEELKLDYVAVTRAKKRLDPGTLDWVRDYTSGDDELAAPSAGEEPVELPSDIPPPPPGPSGIAETPDEYAPEEANALMTPEASERVQDVDVVTETVPQGPPSGNYEEKIDNEVNLIIEQIDDSMERGDKFEKKAAKELQKTLDVVEKFKNGEISADEAAEKIIEIEQGLREMKGLMKYDAEIANDFADMARDLRRVIDRSDESGARFGKDLPPEGLNKGFDKNGVFIAPGMRVRDKWGYAGTVVRYNKSGGWNNVYILKDVDHRDPDQLSEAQRKKWGPGTYIDSKGTKTLTVIKDGDDNSPWIDMSKKQDGERKPPRYEEQLAEYEKKKKRGEGEGEDGGEGPVGVEPSDGPDADDGGASGEPEAGTTEALRENIEEQEQQGDWSGEEASRTLNEPSFDVSDSNGARSAIRDIYALIDLAAADGINHVESTIDVEIATEYGFSSAKIQRLQKFIPAIDPDTQILNRGIILALDDGSTATLEDDPDYDDGAWVVRDKDGNELSRIDAVNEPTAVGEYIKRSFDRQNKVKEATPKAEAPSGAAEAEDVEIGDAIATPDGEQGSTASRMPEDDILVKLMSGGGSSDKDVDFNNTWATHLSQHKLGSTPGDDALKDAADLLALLWSRGKFIDVRDEDVVQLLIEKKMAKVMPPDENHDEEWYDYWIIPSVLHGIAGFTSGRYRTTETEEEAESIAEVMKSDRFFGDGGGMIDSPANYSSGPLEDSVADFWRNFATVLSNPDYITDFKNPNLDVSRIAPSAAGTLLRTLRVASPIKGDFSRVLHFMQDINDESHPLNYLLNEGQEFTMRPTSWMGNDDIENIELLDDGKDGLFQYGDFGKVDGALGDVLFTISNPRGLDARPLPNDYGETEVILSGGRYKVVKVEKKEIEGRPYTHIKIEDVTAKKNDDDQEMTEVTPEAPRERSSKWAAPLPGSAMSSVPSARDAISIVNDTPTVQAQTLMDGDDIERMQVSFSVTKEKNDPDGNEKLRMMFTLSTDAFVQLKQAVSRESREIFDPTKRMWSVKERTPIGFKESTIADQGRVQYGKGLYRATEEIGTTYIYTDPDGRFTVTIIEPTEPYYGMLDQRYTPTSATAIDRLVTVEFADYPDDLAIQDALSATGVRSSSPSTETDLRSMVEREIAIRFMGNTNDTLKTQPGAAGYAAEQFQNEFGVSIVDAIELSTTPYGMTEIKMPEEAAREIMALTGVSKLSHSYYDSPANFFSGTISEWAEKFVKKLADDQSALLSTVQRFSHGSQFRGQSYDTDMATGGANLVYLTPSSTWFETTTYGAEIDRGTDVVLSWQGQDAVEVLRRLDTWSNFNDLYGAHPEGTRYLDRLAPGSYELTVRDHLPLSGVTRVYVSKKLRNALLKAAYDAGIQDINDTDVRNFFSLPNDMEDPDEWTPNLGEYGKEGGTV